MKTVYLSLQSKGGVSKSTTLIMLYQYLVAIGQKVKAYDTDPNNATMAAFKALNVDTIDIMDEHHNIDPLQFDSMVEGILSSDADAICIDVGATSFNPLLGYLIENDTISLLEDYGIDVVGSIPICGGSEHAEAIKCLNFLFKKTPIKMLIWMNPYFGSFPTGKDEPVAFIKQALKGRLMGIVEMPKKNSDTFGKAIQELQGERLTFEEYLTDDLTQVVKKHRIKTYRKELFEDLDKIFKPAEQPVEV